MHVASVELEDAVDALGRHLFITEDVAMASFFERHGYADLGKLAAQFQQGELAHGVENTASALVAAFAGFEPVDHAPALIITQ